MDNVNITAKEYKQLILDAELYEERRKLVEATTRYHEWYKETEEQVAARWKNDFDELKEKRTRLQDKINKYESNWFVKLFLKEKRINNRINW